MKKFFSWFDTAPKAKSDKVLKIEKDEEMNLLIDAVEAERKGKKSPNKFTVKGVK
jgi:hypothetical protein